jgi:hypothetical protein
MAAPRVHLTRKIAALTLAGAIASGRVARADEARKQEASNERATKEQAGAAVPVNPVVAAGVWTAMQLVPSPLFVVGSGNVGGGLRWQVTPFVYSFGVAAKPVRVFVVEPVARHAGAVELYASPEWACCAPTGTSWVGRGGARLYLPLVGRGESLSGSIGTSYYRAAGGDGFSAELGAYALFGTIGLTVTFSPKLEGRETMLALALRYF